MPSAPISSTQLNTIQIGDNTPPPIYPLVAAASIWHTDPPHLTVKIRLTATHENGSMYLLASNLLPTSTSPTLPLLNKGQPRPTCLSRTGDSLQNIAQPCATNH